MIVKRLRILVCLMGGLAVSSCFWAEPEPPVEEPVPAVVEEFVPVPEPLPDNQEMSAKEHVMLERYKQLTDDLKQRLGAENPNSLYEDIDQIHELRMEARNTVLEKEMKPLNMEVASILAERMGTDKQKPYDKEYYKYFENTPERQPSGSVELPELPPRIYYPEVVNGEFIAVTLESIEEERGFFLLNLKVTNKKDVAQYIYIRNVQLVNRTKKVLKPEDRENRWKVPGEYDIYKYEGGAPHDDWEVFSSGSIYRQFTAFEEQSISLRMEGSPDFDKNNYSLMLSCNTSSFLFNLVFPSEI